MTNAEYRARAAELLKPQFGTVLLSMIIASIVCSALNAIPAVGSVACLLLSGPLGVGLALVCTTVTAGGTAKIEQIFEPLQQNFVNCFVASLLQSIFVALWCLLLVIPGIMKAYSYSMTYYVLRYEPDLSGMDALKRSEQLMAGHRMDLFKLQFSYFGWMLLCCLTCGILYLWVGPRMELAKTLFFDQVYAGNAKAC